MDPNTASGESIARQLYDEISTRPLTVKPYGTTLGLLAENRPYSDLYECLLCECHAGFMKSEVSHQPSEETPVEPTSAYEHFAALCAAMPRWAGHPLYTAMHGVLAHVFDCHLPMNEKNAPAIWRFCSEKLMCEDIGPKDILMRMGVDTVYLPTYPIQYLDPAREGSMISTVSTMQGLRVKPLLRAESLTDPREPIFWYPLTEKEEQPFENLADYTAAITTAIQRFASLGGTTTEITLPQGWRFQRPDPYHANMVLQKAMAAQSLSDEEAHLLTAQTLRIWGQACAKAHLSIIIEGGEPYELIQLMTYLQECGGFEKITFLSKQMPENLDTACDLWYTKGISLGLSLDGARTPEAIRERLITYAAHAPIGCLSDVYLPVFGAADVWTLIETRRILCELLGQWAAQGRAPTDFDHLLTIAERI